MSFFSNFFGPRETGSTVQDKNNQTVIAYFDYLGGTDLDRLFLLEEELEKAILADGVGVFDGNEIRTDGNDGSLWMFGPDADKLFETVRPILKKSDAIKNVRVLLRYGLPRDGAEEKIVEL